MPEKLDTIPMPEKLDTTRVFDHIFRIYRERFGLLVSTAFVVFLIPAIVAIALEGASVPVAIFIATAVSLVAFAVFQAMIIETVKGEEEGERKLTFGSLFQAAKPFIFPVIGAGVLMAMGIALGLMAFVIPGLVLMTIWAVVIPVVVMERPPIMAAFVRSYKLVVGNGLRVFGVLVVTFLLTFLVRLLFTQIAIDVSNTALAAGIGSLIAQSLLGPLFALAAAVLYFELRQLHGEATTDEAHQEDSPLWGTPTH